MGIGNNCAWFLSLISLMSIIYLSVLAIFVSFGNEYLGSRASSRTKIQHLIGAVGVIIKLDKCNYFIVIYFVFMLLG